MASHAPTTSRSPLPVDLAVAAHPPSAEIEAAVAAVERIIGHGFKNRRLLEEALTHPSCTDSASNYQRLEFLGDAALGLAVSNHVFLAYPDNDPGDLSSLRSANISTEKLARVAVHHGLYRFVRRNVPALDEKVREFSEAFAHGGSIKAPKVLADIVESIAAAIYVDVNFDLQSFWEIFRGLLEPMVTLQGLLQQRQPVTGNVDIRHRRDKSENVASVYVDGKFVASGSSEHKETAKLNAANSALRELSKSLPITDGLSEINDGISESFEIEGAKQKFHELYGKKRIEKQKGPAHERTFVSSVQISTVIDKLFIMGDVKSRVRDAVNSAASLMIRALKKILFYFILLFLFLFIYFCLIDLQESDFL